MIEKERERNFMDNGTIEAFFALESAGLWEKEVKLPISQNPDFQGILMLAREQAVCGLVTAGLDHVSDLKIKKTDSMPFLKEVVMTENRNIAMNDFISKLFNSLEENGVKAVLVKGQGVAQCYERPLWRSAGDIDLFFDEDNYQKAKTFLAPQAASVESEDKRKKHLAITIDSWLVELHGLMPTEISERINAGVVSVQKNIFENGGVRFWDNNGVNIPLPSPDNDVVIIFTHFIQHFFVGGVGLRQISDWCRLLWTYRETIDRELLERRLRDMGLMSEWKAFAEFAVDYLGMPVEAMPFFEESRMLKRQARKIRSLIIHTGNFGHNKDQSYRREHPGLLGRIITFFRRLGEFIRLTQIFPWDGPRFFMTYLSRRTEAVL
jgi:hypothetical protein